MHEVSVCFEIPIKNLFNQFPKSEIENQLYENPASK